MNYSRGKLTLSVLVFCLMFSVVISPALAKAQASSSGVNSTAAKPAAQASSSATPNAPATTSKSTATAPSSSEMPLPRQRQGLGQHRDRRLPQGWPLVWQDESRKVHDRSRGEGCRIQGSQEGINGADYGKKIHDQNSRRAFCLEPDGRGSSRQILGPRHNYSDGQDGFARHQLGNQGSTPSPTGHRTSLLAEDYRRPSLREEDRFAQ